MGRALIVEHLSVRYAGSRDPALDRVSFDLPTGGSLAVLGPAGAGKSTLFGAVTGLLQAQQHATVDGIINVVQLDPARRNPWATFPAVSMVPQDPRHALSGFVPTVREECHLTLRQAGVEEDLWSTAVQVIAETLNIVHLLDRDPRTLSGGETQSVALAIMAVARPSLLLLDEPATSLDQDRLDALTRFLLHRPARLGVMLADTALHASVLACDRILVLERGRTVYLGTREDFWLRLPEFQDLVTLGSWLEVRRAHRNPDAASFLSALELAC